MKTFTFIILLCCCNKIEGQCDRQVDNCVSAAGVSCFGEPWPKGQLTSLVLVNGTNVSQVLEALNHWRALQSVSDCWQIIQPLLCSVYFPPCQTSANNSSTISLPGRDVCLVTREPCQLVDKLLPGGWPQFLQCDQPHFVDTCSVDKPTNGYNTSLVCQVPLVASAHPATWVVEGVHGCGLPCVNVNATYSSAEYQSMRRLIAGMGAVCLLCTVFTIATFIVDWQNANHYPAKMLFYINLCFIVGCIGWLLQLFPGLRTSILCRDSDQVLRVQEPQGSISLCLVVFLMIYFSSVAALMWFAILSYTWYVCYRQAQTGSWQTKIEKKKAIFHIGAWCVALVLSIACMALTQVDANPLTGVCFVTSNYNFRIPFVLVPVCVVILIGITFLVRGLLAVVRLQCHSPGSVNDKVITKIQCIGLRIGIFIALTVVILIITFAVHIYIFVNEPSWNQAFTDFIYCQLKTGLMKAVGNSDVDVCQRTGGPNFAAMQAHVFAYFASGIALSSWVWTKETVWVWQRFIRRKCGTSPPAGPVKVRKHEVIAHAFSRRSELQTGRLSLSIGSQHDDPLGMRLDISSISSQELTSAWAAALPRMLARRGALVDGSSYTTPRRYSDSDLDSISSLQQKLAELQREANLRAGLGSHLTTETNSQVSHESEYHRGRRKRRRHRKERRKRGSSQTTLSSPSPTDRSRTVALLHELTRKSSFTSQSTHPSLTNVSNLTGNPSGSITPLPQQLLPSSTESMQPSPAPSARNSTDTGKVVVCATASPNRNSKDVVTRHSQELQVLKVVPAEDDIGSSDEGHLTPGHDRPYHMIALLRPGSKQSSLIDKVEILSSSTSSNISLDLQDVEDLHSSDEAMYSDEDLIHSRTSQEEEDLCSSDEECITPASQQPPTSIDVVGSNTEPTTVQDSSMVSSSVEEDLDSEGEDSTQYTPSFKVPSALQSLRPSKDSDSTLVPGSLHHQSLPYTLIQMHKLGADASTLSSPGSTPHSPTFHRLVQVVQRVQQWVRPRSLSESSGGVGGETSSELSRVGSGRGDEMYSNRAYLLNE